MNITYDKQADAMYIYLQKKKRVARTVELANLLLADLDKKGKVIGVEIIGASRQIAKQGIRTQRAKELFSFSVPLPA